MKKITFLSMILLFALISNYVKAEIYNSFTGTITLGYTEVSTEQAKAQADRWITAVSFPSSNTSGRCSSVASSFNLTNTRSIEFWLDKCDNITINANVATGRGLTISVDGTVVQTINGTNACADFSYNVNKEVPCKIKVTATTSSSAYVSLFKFSYAPKVPTITSFIAEAISATINQSASPRTITANLPFGTSLSAITPTVTMGGTATAYTPTGAVDFTNSATTPVVYTATDATQSTNYNVVLTANKNTDKSLNNLKVGTYTPTYNATNQSYNLVLPKGTTLSQAVTFDLPFRATANFTSGNTQDFSSPLNIMVTAEDGTSQAYAVNVIAATKNIAYVINTAVSATDTKIRPKLAETYYLDNILIANVTTATDFSIYDLVVLTESPSSGSAGMKALWGINKPILGLKMFSVNSNTWNQATATNPSPAALALSVNEPNHPVFAGVTLTGTYGNELDVLSAAATGNGIQQCTATGDLNIANVKGTVLANIVEFPVGKTSDIVGTTNAALQAKLLVIGLSNDNQNLITNDGLKLIENACAYLMGNTAWGTNAGTLFKNIAVTGGTTTAIGSTTATIQWNAVPAAAKYVVAAPSGNVDVAGNLTSYELTGLTPNTEYTITVTAQNAAGVASLTPASIVVNTTSTGFKNVIAGVSFDGKIIRNNNQQLLQVYDAMGRLVTSATNDIDMRGQTSGIYMVKSASGLMKIIF